MNSFLLGALFQALTPDHHHHKEFHQFALGCVAVRKCCSKEITAIAISPYLYILII